jgi:hypothetical protein
VSSRFENIAIRLPTVVESPAIVESKSAGRTPPVIRSLPLCIFEPGIPFLCALLFVTGYCIFLEF